MIGVSASILVIVFLGFLSNSEEQPNATTSTVSNNEISVKSTTHSNENLDKQSNTNLQVKNTENSSKITNKPNNSLERQAEIDKIVALDNKYAQMERDLSERILDFREQLSSLPTELRERLSHTSNETEVSRISDEYRRKAEGIQKQILEHNDQLTLIRAKRQLLPLNAIGK